MFSYSAKLRRLAQYLDEHQLVASYLESKWEFPTVAVYLVSDSFEEFQQVIGDLSGYEKSGYGGQLTAKHSEFSRLSIHEDEEQMFSVYVHVSGVCEKKPKLDGEGNPVTQKRSKYVQTDEEEPVYEWECPPVWSS